MRTYPAKTWQTDTFFLAVNHRVYKMTLQFHLRFILVLPVKNLSDKSGASVRARCYRSMRKNEDPHNISIVFECAINPPRIASFKCSCAAGQGLCQHVIGLLYSLAHYQMLGMKSVPPMISKTSKPQTWHLPNRIDGIKARPAAAVTVQKVKGPSDESAGQPKKKRRDCGVTSTVYKPFDQPPEWFQRVLCWHTNNPSLITHLLSLILMSPHLN